MDPEKFHKRDDHQKYQARALVVADDITVQLVPPITN